MSRATLLADHGRSNVRKPDRDSDDDFVVRRRRPGTHPVAYAFIAASMVFGGVAADFRLCKAFSTAPDYHCPATARYGFGTTRKGLC